MENLHRAVQEEVLVVHGGQKHSEVHNENDLDAFHRCKASSIS